jgi:hypothetical protein
MKLHRWSILTSLQKKLTIGATKHGAGFRFRAEIATGKSLRSKNYAAGLSGGFSISTSYRCWPSMLAMGRLGLEATPLSGGADGASGEENADR